MAFDKRPIAKATFTSLPLEIRNSIYILAIKSEIPRSKNSQDPSIERNIATIKLTLGPSKPPDPSRGIEFKYFHRATESLLRTNKTVREEVINVLATDFFFIGMREFDLRLGPACRGPFLPLKVLRRMRHIELSLSTNLYNYEQDLIAYAKKLESMLPELHSVQIIIDDPNILVPWRLTSRSDPEWVRTLRVLDLYLRPEKWTILGNRREVVKQVAEGSKIMRGVTF